VVEIELNPAQVQARLVQNIVPLVQPVLDAKTYICIGISALHNVINRTSQYYPLKDGWNKGYIELDRVFNPR
jgi:hypothetical protein